MHAMRVEHPTAFSLHQLMLKQIASYPELRKAFYEGSSKTSALEDAETTYIAESLRKRNKKPIYTHETYPNSRYTAGTFNNRGSSIAFGLNQGLLHIVDTTSEEESPKIAEGLAPITALAYTPDDRYIISIDRNHTVRVRNVKNSVLVATYNDLALPADEGVRAVTISTDGSIIARQNSENTTQLWHIGADRLTLQNRLPTTARARQLCLSPDTCKLFIVRDGCSDLYDTTTGALLCSMPFNMDNASFSGNGAWIIAARSGGAFFNYLYIFSTEDPSLPPKKIFFGRRDPNASITALATNHDCTRIAVYLALSGISNYRLNIMNMQTKPPLITHSVRSSWRASKLLLSSDETQLAAFGENSIALWDLCLKNLVATLPKHREFLLTCASYWNDREARPVDHANGHYQYLINNVAFFKHNIGSLFALIDPTPDEESPCPKRARHG